MITLFSKTPRASAAISPRQQLEALEHQLSLKEASIMKLMPLKLSWAERQVQNGHRDARRIRNEIAKLNETLTRLDSRLAA